MKLSLAQVNKIFSSHHHLIVKAVKSLRPEVSGITADDVEQEVSIRLLKLIKSDREIENISSYIYRITANVIIDLARKNQKHVADIGLGEEQDEEDYRPNLISDTLKPSQQLENGRHKIPEAYRSKGNIQASGHQEKCTHPSEHT